MRKVLIVAFACASLLAAALFFARPVISEAVSRLLPGSEPRVDHDLPESYKPAHDGYVNLAAGLYIRENEDLVVRSTPALILRRTYRSDYRVSKEFGIGTLHAADEYIWGGGQDFQRPSLIQPISQINFHRVSPGTSLSNAMYVSRTTAGEWYEARLGWTGSDWELRRRDGAVALFQLCSHGIARAAIMQSRDRDGHITSYRRDKHERLLKMEAGSGWIAFDYDARNRIVRAYASTGRDVRYEYDDRGRLTRVSASDGTLRLYTYTDRDELTTIVEPGTSIENSYDEKGRVVRQITRFDDREPHTIDFSYHLEGGSIVETRVRGSDRSWTNYTWNKDGYATSEARGRGSSQDEAFTYERDRTTNLATALTLTCPDRSGRPQRHTSVVEPDSEEKIKWDLVQTHCARGTSRQRTESSPRWDSGASVPRVLHR